MRLLVTGARGLLGAEFVRVGSDLGHDVVGTGREELDVTNPGQAYAWIRGGGFEWVVHCAAYTAVDRAETEAEVAHRVNVEGTRNVARAARDAGARMVYVSTDYVFDGRSDSPYLTTDDAGPLCVYGVTKLEGERVVAQAFEELRLAEFGGVSSPLIARTGWLYGEGGFGFVRSIIDRASRGEPLRIVNDQRGRPTLARNVARSVLELMSRASVLEREGAPVSREIWHVADGGEGSWLDLASEALRLAGVQTEVHGVSSEEFGALARRPAYSVLDLTETERALGRNMPEWRGVLADVLTQ